MTGAYPPPNDRRRGEDDEAADEPAVDAGADDGAGDGVTDGPEGDGGMSDDGTGDEPADGAAVDSGAADDGADDRTSDRPLPEVVRVEGGGPPSEAVLRAVETAAGVDLAESDERLVDVVDADALDALFGASTASPDGRIEFAFCGCRVTVESDGRVRVTPDDAG